jgi:hypothetical protein
MSTPRDEYGEPQWQRFYNIQFMLESVPDPYPSWATMHHVSGQPRDTLLPDGYTLYDKFLFGMDPALYTPFSHSAPRFYQYEGVVYWQAWLGPDALKWPVDALIQVQTNDSLDPSGWQSRPLTLEDGWLRVPLPDQDRGFFRYVRP